MLGVGIYMSLSLPFSRELPWITKKDSKVGIPSSYASMTLLLSPSYVNMIGSLERSAYSYTSSRISAGKLTNLNLFLRREGIDKAVDREDQFHCLTEAIIC
jgi:hypothetical protein